MIGALKRPVTCTFARARPIIEGDEALVKLSLGMARPRRSSHCVREGMRHAILAAVFSCSLTIPVAAQDFWERYHDPYMVAAGLPPLRTQTLPRGTRELRAWVGGGLGWPQELIRLVDRNGSISGEYIRYWGLENPDSAPESETFAALMRYHEAGRCGPVTRGPRAEACRALFATEPDWARMWRIADSIGVGTLPDASTLKGERMVLDGWGIGVELRDGDSYRAWYYSNPDMQPWPEATKAVAFARALQTIPRLMKRSSAESVFVGRVDVGSDSVEFTPCTGGGPWLLQTYDPRMVRTRTSGPISGVYRVEVRGTLVPEFVVRRWWSAHMSPRFQRALQVDSLLTMRPWTSTSCRD